MSAIVTHSGVSRRTFYEIFVDVRECLSAALEDSLECARVCVRETYDPDEPWRVRIRLVLYALLCFLEDDPARGRLLVVEAPGAGSVALERRARVLGELFEAVDGGRAEAGHTAALTPVTAEGLVGSVLAVVHARLVGSASPRLVELTNPLMSMIVLPYLGAAAARKELDRPLPRRRRHLAQASEGANRLNDLPMRVTYRTVCVLRVMAAQPGASNRQIGQAAGMSDQGQTSKLLQRLKRLGLAVNAEAGQERGMANQWQLTPLGAEIERATGRSLGARATEMPATVAGSFAAAGTFARATHTYWTSVFPQVGRELERWNERAGEISDPALRAQALEALAKRGNMEGAAAFATFVPREHRAAVVRATVAFQTAYNHLDTISEQSASIGPGEARVLHEALLTALACAGPGARSRRGRSGDSGHDDERQIHPPKEQRRRLPGGAGRDLPAGAERTTVVRAGRPGRAPRGRARRLLPGLQPARAWRHGALGPRTDAAGQRPALVGDGRLGRLLARRARDDRGGG